MDDDKAQGWGKTLGGAIGAYFGPEGALVGIAIGGVLEEILPGPKDILGNILGNLGADGLKQAWQQTIGRRMPHAQAQISSDLQRAFRDAVLEGLYDIGGSACFPGQWIKTQRVVPDGATIAPLTDEIREHLQSLAAAIRQGTLLPLDSSAPAAIDAQHYVIAESFGDLNAAFLAHVIGPDKPFRSLRDLPQLHGHLHRHFLDRTLVHLGDLLKQRPATWHEFNRVMFETLLVALRRLGTGQAQIAQQMEHLASAMTNDAFVVRISERQAELLAAIGETNKDVREGITTIFRRVVHQHTEVIARFDQQDTQLHEILNRLAQLLERDHAPRITALHALPARPGDFKGRTDEITQLSEVLQPNAPYGTVVTICGVRGLGGIGKTALAITVAQDIRSNYPDGQLFLELRGASPVPMTPEEALLQVLRAFGLETTHQGTREELVAIYRSLLAGKRVLIVADDAQDEAQVEPLIPPPGSALLITSRSVIRLPGMPEPLRLDTLPEEDAVALILAICKRIGPAAKNLAKLCGYLPLALRISATFLSKSTRPVERYLDELAQERIRLLRLRSGSADTDVEASFNLSYAVLDVRAQMLLRRLGVFAASFDRRAAEQVAWLPDGEPVFDDVLDQLYSMSLLDHDQETDRFSLNDLVRVFVLERLREQGEEQMTWLFYAVHYLVEARVAQALFRQGGDDIHRGLLLFDTERPHIDAIWERARQQHNETTDSLQVALADATSRIGDLRYDMRRERIPQLEAAIEASRRQQDYRAQGRLLGNLGNVYAELKEINTATDYYKQAMNVFNSTGEWWEEGNLLCNMADIYVDLGKIKEGIRLYKQAEVIFNSSGDWWGAENIPNGLGNAYLALGEAEEAARYYKQALIIARERKDWLAEANALCNLGNTYSVSRKVSEAIEHYEQATVMFKKIGDRRGEVNSYWNLGKLFTLQGELNRGIELMQILVDFEREIGHADAEKNAAVVDEFRRQLAEGEGNTGT